jgi:hypothetical protein
VNDLIHGEPPEQQLIAVSGGRFSDSDGNIGFRRLRGAGNALGVRAKTFLAQCFGELSQEYRNAMLEFLFCCSRCAAFCDLHSATGDEFFAVRGQEFVQHSESLK